MLSHVFVGTNDFERAFSFYAALMHELSLKFKFRDDDAGWAGWMAADQPRPLFLIGRPYDGNPASGGNGQMVALLAADRATVDRVRATALARGGSCGGPPGLRPQYHCALLRCVLASNIWIYAWKRCVNATATGRTGLCRVALMVVRSSVAHQEPAQFPAFDPPRRPVSVARERYHAAAAGGGINDPNAGGHHG